MTIKARDPRRLDVAGAAADAAALSGAWPLAALQRLDDAPAGDGAVEWSARFALRPVVGGQAQPWLDLQARTRVWRDCQRCLQPLAIDLHVDRAFRFVADEDTAASLDAECDEDLLVLSRTFDLQALVEDELLLELPLVPRHQTCPQALEPASGAAGPPATAHPFAALAALKRPAGS